MSHPDAPAPPEPADGGEPTMTPRTGHGAQSALEALRRQQRRKPAPVHTAPEEQPPGEAGAAD